MGSCTRLVEMGTYSKTTVGNVKVVTIPMTAFKLEPAIHMLNPASSMDKNNSKTGFDTDNIKAIQFDAGWDSPEGDIIIKTIYFQKIK